MRFVLAAMLPSDWPAVRAIYCEGIASGHATFETKAPSQEAWDQSHADHCRVVARAGADPMAETLGWAALSEVSGRCVYQGVAEVSVYVSSKARAQGLGKALLTQLIELSEEAGVWTLEAGIFPENQASLALHRNSGFRVVGTRERLGRHPQLGLAGGQPWRDVLLMERRSSVVGVD